MPGLQRLLLVGVAAILAPLAQAEAPLGLASPGALGDVHGTDESIGRGSSGSVGVSLGDIAAISRNGLVGMQTAIAMTKLRPEEDSSLRGAREVKLYKQASPAVVLVVTKDGIGSGSLINKGGDILTNWHVVRDSDRVGVIFKPKKEGKELTAADIRAAKIVRYDEIADLALLRVDSVPAGVTPLPIGDMAEVEIGADVHAIGHPTGESWTYTKGVVSQMRDSYEWMGGVGDKQHKANVIQTQTPINPGNSGGPLLTDKGRIIGVNSFKSEGEGLNFAVAANEIDRFLSSKESREAAMEDAQASGECEPETIYQGKHPKIEDVAVLALDLDCDGQVEMEIRAPTDESKPGIIVIDKNKDGKFDVVLIDEGRDEKWDASLYDTDFDGKWDLVGEHPDGGIEASAFRRFEDGKDGLPQG